MKQHNIVIHKDESGTKERIGEIVKTYETVFKGEYQAFKLMMREKRENSIDKYGGTRKTELLERALYEIPETLDVIFKRKLSMEDSGFLQSKEGARWFAKSYPQYRVGEKF